MDELEKYHRVYAKIDLDSIFHNVKMLKSNISKDSTVTAVIKADGYGHGAIPIAKVIDELVSSYAVATIQEAINLREHGIVKPIHIIGYTHKSMFEEAIRHQIRLTIYDQETADELSEVAKILELTAYVHLKIDTGMNRIGFKDNQESIETIKRIVDLDNLNIEGIFTHFCAADSLNKQSANTQLARFNTFINELKECGIHIPIIHCSNSAGIIDLPEADFTNVRAGISIYGLYPSEEVNREQVKLIPALSLKSHIIQVKKVDSGIGVGYGSTYITKNETIIATIPVGYGDGYPRKLSNKGYVLIKGQRAPVIGRVCMDQIMVDITLLNDIKKGDEVTLIGVDEKECITVEELAQLADTFNYEFICDLGKRIPRVYIKDKKIVGMKDYFHDLYNIKI